MMRIIRGKDLEAPRGRGPNVGMVREIVEGVQRGGDGAVYSYEKRFSGYGGPLRVSDQEIQQAYQDTPPDVLDSIRRMAGLVREAEASLLEHLNSTPSPGGMSRSFRPIPSVGCYVPGGQARYPSSAVMSVVPASVAGVGRIAVVTPPSGDGSDASTIAAADHCGAHEIYRTGGAQAVAALAYGTKTMPRVDKIVGPGGGVVTAAKKLVSADVHIDMEAGPTELGILADESADPKMVALDLISQAEHSADTLCFLLTDSGSLARRVSGAIESQIYHIQRSEIVRESLQRNGFLAVFDDMASAAAAAERLAPEHLQVMTKDPEKDAAPLNSPGLILLGQDTPSAASDYMLGSNHILPTGGQGRLRGPLSVLDYTRMRVTVRADGARMADVLNSVRAITDNEGLHNHCEAVMGRVP